MYNDDTHLVESVIYFKQFIIDQHFQLSHNGCISPHLASCPHADRCLFVKYRIALALLLGLPIDPALLLLCICIAWIAYNTATDVL